MEDKFLMIGITSPDRIENEANSIDRLLNCGLDFMHIRKPRYSEKEVMTLIEGISPENRKKLVLHDFHHLAKKYGTGGVHINSRNPDIPGNNIIYSASCHKPEELSSWQGARYCFLSPIYDSISKPGYKSAFRLNELKSHLAGKKVIALGGVTAEKIPELEEAGFSGAAFMGDLWKNIEKYVKQ